ncbi:DsrE family protein [Streptomyces cellulosae]|jgi:intracellular sulfur oxidation DsrE/DsrF family protein|uniref:DsrE family protein n=1 Tax=Streptomyces sp. P9-2 TaxID=3423201 RepID=UPI00167B015B
MESLETVRAVVGVPVVGRTPRKIGNLLKAADLPLEVEAVCYGDGIGLVLADSPHAESVAALQEAGVRFLACANTLKDRDLTTDTLGEGVDVVPAAAWHLVRRQHEGWSYLPL